MATATKIRNAQLTPNFNIKEFDCHDGTPVPDKYYNNVLKLAQNLQVLRDYLGEPIHVNSGYRTTTYNRKLEGSASKSQHLLAKAADITVKSKTPRQLYYIIEMLIVTGKMYEGGHGLYKTFNHYDIRGTKARWENV